MHRKPDEAERTIQKLKLPSPKYLVKNIDLLTGNYRAPYHVVDLVFLVKSTRVLVASIVPAPVVVLGGGEKRSILKTSAR